MGKGKVAKGERDSLLGHTKTADSTKCCKLSMESDFSIEVIRDDKEMSPHCCDGCKHMACNCHWWFFSCLFNTMLCPFVYVYHLVKLFIAPCVLMFIERGLCACLTFICCDCLWIHTDKDFPPNSDSIGETDSTFAHGAAPEDTGCCEAREFRETGGDLEWKRAYDVFKDMNLLDEENKTPCVVEGAIEARDVGQGSLGNCWLLAALACMADNKGVVNQALVQKQYNPRGRYTINMVDSEQDTGDSLYGTDSGHGWMEVSVDDYFPCKKGKPVFCKPNGPEMWVMIIEKAFAKSKYYGTYAALEGGHVAFALFLLTGARCKRWKWTRDKVDADGMSCKEVSVSKKNEQGQIKPMFRQLDEKSTKDDFFLQLDKWVSEGFIVGAGTDGSDDRSLTEDGRNAGGIVPGHAYGIKDCQEVKKGDKTERILLLRNPWNQHNMTGDWSKDSGKWDEFGLGKDSSLWKKAYGTEDKGTFWYSYAAFLDNFLIADVCERKQSVEDAGMEQVDGCSLCTSCCAGVTNFLCCCVGCRKLYCNRLCPMDTRRDEALGIENIV